MQNSDYPLLDPNVNKSNTPVVEDGHDHISASINSEDDIPRTESFHYQVDVGGSGFRAQVTSYRWLIFTFFIFDLLVLSAISLSFSPISTDLASAYNVSIITVNFCAICFTAT